MVSAILSGLGIMEIWIHKILNVFAKLSDNNCVA